jgi:cytochrome c-type biogenesis protein CcmF
VDALGLPKPSVGPPWFNLTFVPLMLPLLALVGLSYGANWLKADWKGIRQKSVGAAFGAVVLGICIPLFTPDVRGFGVYGACILAAWTIAAAVAELGRWSVKRRLPPASALGMMVAHAGLGVFAIGVAMVTHADIERDVALRPGEFTQIGDQQWKFHGTSKVEGANYTADRAQIEVTQDGQTLTWLYPEKRAYHSQPGNPMAESDIDIGLTRDLYVALGESLGEGSWSLRIYKKPFIRWIWFGAIIMALGGGIAASDRRYRMARETKSVAGEEKTSGLSGTAA